MSYYGLSNKSIVRSHKYQPVLSKETNGEAITITEFEAPETYEEKIYKEISCCM